MTAYELAIVGGGLSGSLVLLHLIDTLCHQHPSVLTAGPLRVLAVEPQAELGPGVPYGCNTTRSGFLMVESVARSTPVAFQDWLKHRAPRLLRELRQEKDELISHWLPLNEKRLLAGEFEELFVPRRVFGQFVLELLAERIRLAARDNLLDLTVIRGTATDVLSGPDVPFRIQTAEGGEYCAGTIVLAVGCNRRRNSFDLGLKEGYVHDPYADAFESLRRAILARPRGIDVMVMGSGAAASEVIYYLALSGELRARLRSIHVVSVSGYLAGGAVRADEDPDATRPWARTRPAAREYVDTARDLFREGKLRATAARVVRARVCERQLEVLGLTKQGDVCLHADVLVNCAGTGRLADTGSPLLAKLIDSGRPYSVNSAEVGLMVHPGTYELHGVPGGFLIGPLLNQRSPETHVESVHAVYRVAEPVARAVFERLCARGAGPERATASAANTGM